MIGLVLLILFAGVIGYVVRLDMFPGFIRNDFPDITRRNPELSGNVERAFTSGNPFAYIKNLATRQFGSMDSRPLDSGREWMVISALLCHINHIVFVCALKQMVGTHTGSIGNITDRIVHVAMVTNLHAVWNGAVMQFIAEAMGISRATVCVKHAVPGTLAGLPKPAGIGLEHLRPESLFGGINMASKVVLDIAKGLTLDPAAFFAVLWCNRRELTASTLTVAVRDFVRGMITHVISSFQLLTKAQGISRCRWALPIGVTATPF